MILKSVARLKSLKSMSPVYVVDSCRKLKTSTSDLDKSLKGPWRAEVRLLQPPLRVAAADPTLSK